MAFLILLHLSAATGARTLTSRVETVHAREGDQVSPAPARLPPTSPGATGQTRPGQQPVAGPGNARFRRHGGVRVPGRYIVVLREGTAGITDAEVATLATSLAARHGGTREHLFRRALKGFSVRLTEAQAQLLSDDPRVEYVEEDGVIEGSAVQTDVTNIGLDRVDQRSPGADSRYTYWSDGTGAHIYVLDTGIRTTHEAFGGRATADFSAVADGIPAGTDCNGHGTAVAGVAGGALPGVAKNVRLHAVKVLGCDNFGSWADYVAGMDWVIANHVKPAVINSSINGGFSFGANQALARAVTAGIVHVNSAGNGATDACSVSPMSALSGVLHVGNVKSWDDARYSSSNYGPCVDLFAPGVSILTANAGGDASYASRVGTSFSAPLVAGAAALYLQNHPGASPAEVEAAIVSSATAGVLTAVGTGSPNLLLFTPPLGDTDAPSVSILAPWDGTSISGTTLLEASASDNVEVRHVRFYVNGVEVARDAIAPYRVAWDTTTAGNGVHTIYAQAVDVIGHVTDSGYVQVSVENTSLPPGQVSGSDVGDVATPGGDIVEDGTHVVWGSGSDIWGTADAFRFVHATVSGNFDVVAQVASVEHVDPWTKGGLMVRERLTAGSRHASVFATAANGVAFQRRLAEDDASVHTSGSGQSAPVWLRLVREGDVISAFQRPFEGDSWTLIDSETFFGLPDSVYVGMAVTSHREDVTAEARFQLFAITTATPGGGPLPAGWESADVGAVAAAGDVQFDGSTFTVRGSGADIWEFADAFRFAYVRAPADGAMTVRVAAITGPHEWSKAGLMIRQSLTAGSVHHYLAASAANGLAYQRRVATGDASLHTTLGGSTPVWFRIERHDELIWLYYSTESGTPSTWHLIVDTPFPAGEAFIGLAVTSHADGERATGLFDGITHTFGAASSSAWIGADVGAVGITGADMAAGDTQTLSASGADIWDTADAFHYRYSMLPGDGTLVARLTSLSAAHEWAKAGVMIRASTDGSAAHGFLLLARDHGVAFQRRTDAGAPTVHTAGPAVNAPVWLRLTRSGPIVTAAVSFDGGNWSNVGADTLSIGAGPVLVGLALTSHDDTALASATFDQVVVSPSP